LGADRFCDQGYICIGGPCPEADRCGTECCVEGQTCVNKHCEDNGCEAPCGGGCCSAGQTCQGGQCTGGGGPPTPTPNATSPGGTPIATATPTPSETPTDSSSQCDAGKLGCIAKRQACLLAVHVTAEKNGEAPVVEALQKCVDTFGGCIAKLESKQKPTKPKTLCSVTGGLGSLTSAGDAFVTNVVTTIHPSFPTVGLPSVCDAGKKGCGSKLATCLFKLQAAAVKKGVLVDSEAVAKCKAKFDGGAKGFAKGCIGTLQAKQNPGQAQDALRGH
jgi:hypothetical protein